MPERQGVEQRLGRMFVLPVTGIENWAVDLAGDQPHCAGRPVTDNDGIGAHGVERDRRIDQRLALLHRALRRMHVDHIRAQPLAGDLEAQQRARGVLEEGVDDGQAGQRVAVLAGLAVKLHPLFRLGEEEQDFVGFQRGDGNQVAVREGPRTDRKAALRR